MMAELDLSPQRIRGHRDRLGLTRPNLAARTGLTSDYVKKIERGIRQPSLAAFFELCQAFGVMPNDLLRGSTDDDREYHEGRYWRHQERRSDRPPFDWTSDGAIFI